MQYVKSILKILAVLIITQAIVKGDEPFQLEVAKKTLDAYYSSIKTIKYTCKSIWDESSATSKWRALEKVENDRLEELQKGKKRYSQAAPTDEIYSIREIIEAFPSIKIKMHVHDNNNDYKTLTQYLNKDSYVQVNEKSETVAYSQNVNPGAFQLLPTNLYGLRMLYSTNQKLSSLLNKECVQYVGEESIQGQKTAVLKLGPDFKVVNGPSKLPAGSWLQVWLRMDKSYLPLRIQYYLPNKNLERNIQTLEIGDYSVCRDAANNEKVEFPGTISNITSIGVSTYKITNVKINEQVPKSEFAPVVPTGFTVFRDGIKATKTLQGGDTARLERVKEINAEAKRLLNESNDSVQTGSSSLYTTGIRAVISLFVGITILGLYYWRFRRD